MPAGIAAAIVTLTSYWVARSPLVDATLDQSRTASTVALVLFGFWVLYVLMTPADRLDVILLSSLVAVFVVGMLIEPLREFYKLEPLPTAGIVSTGVIVVAGIAISQIAVRERARRSNRPLSAAEVPVATTAD